MILVSISAHTKKFGNLFSDPHIKVPIKNSLEILIKINNDPCINQTMRINVTILKMSGN